jgi:eukaryotic-like serine/threonine-protein kinase
VTAGNFKQPVYGFALDSVERSRGGQQNRDPTGVASCVRIPVSEGDHAIMNDVFCCPNCGTPRPETSPEGLCARCLLEQALVASAADGGLSLTEPQSHGLELTVSLEPASSSVLKRIGESIGGLPHLLLQDSEIDAGPGPVLKPSSPEVPGLAQRPEKYQLFGEIARGGMGAVIKGRDVDLGRELAVKVLLDSHKDNPDLVRRFVEEAQIGGQLQHPGVVPIYELGSFADRRPFFTMKLVKGRTLAELLRSRQSSPALPRKASVELRGSDREAHAAAPKASPVGDLPRLLSIFESVAQTLAYAHVRGVIHRDLKPSNIMVGSFGEVQVMDWGLAKVLPRGGAADDEPAPRAEPGPPVSVIQTARADSDASHAGSVLGTPGYMAPEQARGEISAIDERADVFGLGAILCEILTGEPAFVGRDSGEALRKAWRGELSDAYARLDHCGAAAELVALAKDCLASEPLDRPRRAGIVVERISAYLAGVQERLRHAELAQVEERARRRLTMAVAASILALLFVGGGAWGYLERKKAFRRAAVERVVSEALDEASLLRGQARLAVGDERSRWSEALSAAKRADGLLASGEVDDALHLRVRTVLAALEQEQAAANARAESIRRDRELLGRLESIRGARSEHWDTRRTDKEYASAFRDIGIDVDRLGPKAAGDWLHARSEPVELASYLDDWASGRRAEGGPEPEWRTLVETARVTDPDPWRDRVRAKLGTQDAASTAFFRALADDTRALDAQPAVSLVLLARQLLGQSDRARAEAVLSRAWRRQPDDFWINYELGRACWNGKGYDRPPEAVRFFSAAVAIRPQSSVAHYSLGSALVAQQMPDEAIAEFRAAIRLKSDFAEPYYGLGVALHGQEKTDEAIAAFRTAIRLRPDDAAAHSALGSALRARGKLDDAIGEFRAAIGFDNGLFEAHHNLGIALHGQKNFDEAIAEYRTAIRLRPDHAEARTNLASALQERGSVDEAIAAYREAIRIAPELFQAHNGLGTAFHQQKKLGDAIAAYRMAVRLKPGDVETHINLANALRDLGNLDEAIEECRVAIRLKPDDALAHVTLGTVLRWKAEFGLASAEFRKALELASHSFLLRLRIRAELLQTEHEADVAARLPAVIRGEQKPKGALDALELAYVAQRTKRFPAAAQLFADSMRDAPRLLAGLVVTNRYSAACAAAMAAAGKGEGDGPIDEKTKARWRSQAIEWLRAELTEVSKDVEKLKREERSALGQTLRDWKASGDLAGIRDDIAVKGLPESDQKACRTLWADVDALLKKVEAR